MTALHATLPGLELPGTVDTVVNWGLGVDSTAMIARILEDPAAHGVDLDRTAVVHMATGNEWPDTLADAERHMLPLLREHGVRLVQLARAGQSDRAGIEVLDDSRSPQRLIARGAWTLWDEMEANGTVPQQGGVRRCSIRAKGSVGDRWIPTATGGRPFVQLMGFNADEASRAVRDAAAGDSPVRTGRFPLIEWGWGRRDCEEYLHQRFGVRWRKSYCWFCCYPISMGAMEANLQRMRAFPDIAGRVLRLEYVATCLNPNAKLFGVSSLLERFDPAAPADRPVLDAFARELDCPWALYRVRRILPVAKDNPARRAPALRSVQQLALGTRAQVGRRLETASARHGLSVQTDPAHGMVRTWLRHRRDVLPTVEELLVTAPAYVRDKQQKRFEKEWAAHVGRLVALPVG
ncbi:hypothetical protein [Streptomyces megasporus]|uniref:hypothetical protein n=1 Tax=Streptomyces megasporus TaxID=44060 RepID=UPI0004E2870A|nr:hypothetical protein [Streptomyces megasporus]